MNDLPLSNVYQSFLSHGFLDSFNPSQNFPKMYPPTFGPPGNSWTTANLTLDYIFVRPQDTENFGLNFELKIEDLRTNENLSLSDHGSVSFNITFQ